MAKSIKSVADVRPHLTEKTNKACFHCASKGDKGTGLLLPPQLLDSRKAIDDNNPVPLSLRPKITQNSKYLEKFLDRQVAVLYTIKCSNYWWERKRNNASS